jgi:hypothetical protein
VLDAHEDMFSAVPTLVDRAETELEENTMPLVSDVIVGPVRFPVELIVPYTSSLYDGAVVPMPSLPVVSSLIYSVYVGCCVSVAP